MGHHHGYVSHSQRVMKYMIVSQLSLLFFWMDGWYKCSWENIRSSYIILYKWWIIRMRFCDFHGKNYDHLQWKWMKMVKILTLNLRCSLSFSAFFSLWFSEFAFALDLGDSPIMKHSARDSLGWKPDDDLWLPAAWLEQIGMRKHRKSSQMENDIQDHWCPMTY